MYTQLIATMATVAMSVQDLATYLQGLFGSLFLGIVGIVAIFFLFTRAVTRFVQFIALCRDHCGHLLHARHRGHACRWHSERARSPLIINQEAGGVPLWT